MLVDSLTNEIGRLKQPQLSHAQLPQPFATTPNQSSLSKNTTTSSAFTSVTTGWSPSFLNNRANDSTTRPSDDVEFLKENHSGPKEQGKHKRSREENDNEKNPKASKHS
jgi:hypothetical protein